MNRCYLNSSKFADEIVLLSTRKEELQEMANELDRESRKAELKMNGSKTKYMSNQRGSEGEIKIGGEVIEKVEVYAYLGQIISIEEGVENEIKARRNKAWRKLWAMRKIFDSRLSLKAKGRILESCVIPILTYGAET